jgi:hypothetical protein
MFVDRLRCQMTIVSRDPVGLADALALIDEQAAQGLWSFAVLHDARAVTWVPTPEDMRTIFEHTVSLSRQYGLRGPLAFVTSQRAAFGLTRLHELSVDREGLRFKACSTVAEAEAWLADVSAR